MAMDIIKPPTQGGAPPAPPADLPSWEADEGPMRRELRRQIAALERELAGIVSRSCPWEPRTVNMSRGPAIQTGGQLEEIRDELLASLDHLCRRIDGALQSTAQAQLDAAAETDERDGRAGWRRLTRR